MIYYKKKYIRLFVCIQSAHVCVRDESGPQEKWRFIEILDDNYFKLMISDC